MTQGAATPFRFYDNRQKYLAFINTCNEKQVIAAKAAAEIAHVRPRPPALKIFDAGVGDATVLSRLLRTVHRHFPTVPVLAVGKEISLEDVRLGAREDARPLPRASAHRVRDHQHQLRRRAAAAAERPRRGRARSTGTNTRSRALGGRVRRADRGARPDTRRGLADAAESRRPATRSYVQPSVLVLYRADHEFLLDAVIPRPGASRREYDFILASQPWRASMPAAFKAEKILAPLARSLAPRGRLLTIQSWDATRASRSSSGSGRTRTRSRSTATRSWPRCARQLGSEAADFDLTPPPDHEAVFRYQMHTLPSEIGDRIGTSTLLAAWNAVIYVNQVEDDRLEQVMRDGSYLETTQEVLNEARRALVQRRGVRRYAQGAVRPEHSAPRR